MKTTFAILLLSAASFVSFAQSQVKEISVMFGKKWSIVAYGLAGQRLAVDNIPKEDITIFNADGSYHSVEKGTKISGKWSYNPATAILTVKKTGQEELTQLLVLSVGETETILESIAEPSTDQAFEPMTIYLAEVQ